MSAEAQFAKVLEGLEAIGATSSMNHKRELIRRYLQYPLFVDVVHLALNPYLVFHMSGNIEGQGDAASACGEMEIIGRLFKFAEMPSLSRADKEGFAGMVRACGPEAVDVVNRVLNKDLRCRASVQTFRSADAVFRELLPVHHPMKGIDDLRKFWKAAGSRSNVCWSIKLDGVRCFAAVNAEKRTVAYLSSNGKELPNFGVFDAELLKAADRLQSRLPVETIVFDGEVINAHGDFSRNMSQLRRIREMDASGFRFRIFDCFGLPLPSAFAFRERYGMLLMNTPFSLWCRNDMGTLCAIVEHLPVRVHPQMLAKEAIAQGFEGIMLKTWDAPYKPQRVNYWCKIKAVRTEDLPVVSKVEGTGKYAGMLGALVVERGGVRVEVGSGFTDAERREFWEEPPACIEVKYQEALASGSLRFPVFVRARDDK